MGFFLGAHGQITPQSVVGSDPNSNSYEILWLSSLSARLKKILSIMKELEWAQDLFRYNPMEAICCHETRVLVRSGIMQLYPNPGYPMMLQLKFGCDRPTACGDYYVYNC